MFFKKTINCTTLKNYIVSKRDCLKSVRIRFYIIFLTLFYCDLFKTIIFYINLLILLKPYIILFISEIILSINLFLSTSLKHNSISFTGT